MNATSTPTPVGTRSLEHIRISEAMHHGVLSCPFDTPLAEVARMMATHRVHAIVGFGDIAADETRVWGVVSDRDVVAMAGAGADLDTQVAGDSAATEVLSVGPHESLRRAAQLLHEHGLSHLLVLEPGHARPIGIISTLDIVAAVAGIEPDEHEAVGSGVGGLMTTHVVTVPPELPLKDVAAILVERGISGVPVVRDGEVLGVLSEADIVAHERGAAPERRRSLGWILRRDGDSIDTHLAAQTAGDAMTAPAITLEPWQSAAHAATVMTRQRIKRLPVLDRGRLVGIVTRTDLVRAFARPDAEIEREIRERVVVRDFWQLPEDIEISVDGGNVTLSGVVDGPISVEALPEAVQDVPGVVSVTSTLVPRGGQPSARTHRRRGYS